MRNIAEELCTQQLGYRTALDAAEAERREIFEHRFTSLDREIIRRSEVPGKDTSGELMLQTSAGDAGQRDVVQFREQHVVSRLAFLETMGLATQSSPGWWRVQRNFESILRAMQRTNDRQKMISAHGVLASDDRLPIRVLQWQDHPDGIQGRILVHGEDDFSGRNYLMLEGTDARIHFVHYTPEMEAARSQGQLRTNSFVKLQRILSDDHGTSTDIRELGDADSLFTNRGHFRSEAQRLINRGIIPTEDGWGGWLGEYQGTLRRAAADAVQERQPNRERRRHLDVGR